MWILWIVEFVYSWFDSEVLQIVIIFFSFYLFIMAAVLE